MSDNLSTIIVTGTLYLLAAYSAVTWALVLAKALSNERLRRLNERFTSAFWQQRTFPVASSLEPAKGPAARIAKAGLSALDERTEASGLFPLPQPEDRRELLERTLRQQLGKERRQLERGLAVFASIGTTAPFVGLFGTVFGIMHALQSISTAQSASIEVVARPIGEALVATGIGIAVAVPAVLAYNIFLRRLKSLFADLEDFAADLFSAALRRSFRVPHVPAAEQESA